MKIIIAILLCSFLASADEETDKAREASLEKFRKYTEERRSERNREVKEQERRNADGQWMLQLYTDYREKGKELTNDEMRRIWEIYEKKDQERTNDDPLGERLYAFALICEFEDISKWQQEFEKMAFSDDTKEVTNAIRTLQTKLARGTEREKIILSNMPDILDRFVNFAKTHQFGESDPLYHKNTLFYKDTVRIHEIAKPYVGKTPPAEGPRPTRRPIESAVEGTRPSNKSLPESSTFGSFLQRIGKGAGLTFAGIIGIIIATILIWRWKSKSTP